MKGNYLYIACGFVLASMMACTNDTPGIRPTDEEASRIYLSAGVGEPAVSSRTPYQYEVPTMTQPLDVSVWASTTQDVFQHIDGKNGSDGTVAIHTQAHFQSGAPQLLGEAIYPKADANATAKTVYFVGFHPKSDEWTASDDNKSASYTFTGKEDVMFAPQISGEYGTAYEASPTFHFHHLLTYIRIEMVADKDEEDVEKKEEVSQAWGSIESMTISSVDKVTVNNLGSTDFSPDNVVFGNDEISMSFYQTGTDNTFPPASSYEIPVNETEVAYVLCAPVKGEDKHVVNGKDVPKPEYTLHIKTEKRELDVPIDLMKKDGDAVSHFTDNTMGYQFVVQLNFKMGNVIGVSAAISLDANTDWFTHGTGSTDLKEEHFTENE